MPDNASNDNTLNTGTIGYSSSVRSGEENREAKFDGFLAQPKGDTKRGSVIVVHEIFGLTDHIRDVACRYAQHGYTALALNLFTREGEPPSLSGGFEPFRSLSAKCRTRKLWATWTARWSICAVWNTLTARLALSAFVGVGA